MDWNQPISTAVTSALAGFPRVVTMLGHYDFRVYFDDASYLDVGAGSLPLVNNLARPPSLPKGCVGSIGRYCEINDTARISVLSQHDNDRAVNIVFAGVPFARERHTQALKPQRLEIGNNVLISAGAHLISGSVGDACVIGAGAIVTRDLEPYGVYVGAPAKRIRDRQECAPWWDFATSYLFENLSGIEAVARDLSRPHVMRLEAPRFVIKTHGQNLEFMGYAVGESIAPLSSAPARVGEYVRQALSTDNPYWLADCWR